MKSITLNLGQTLGVLVTPRDADGDAIVLDDTWDVAAAIAPFPHSTPATDLGATIDDSGKVAITYDTIDLAAGKWVLDIRLTHPASGDNWTEKIEVQISRSITPPSPRD